MYNSKAAFLRPITHFSKSESYGPGPGLWAHKPGTRSFASIEAALAFARRPVVFCSLPLLVTALLSAQQLQAEDFESALRRSLETHTSVEKERLRFEAQSSRATFADFVYPDPEIMVGTMRTDRQDTAVFPANYNRMRMSNYEVQVMQPIPFPGKLTAESNVEEFKSIQAKQQYIMASNRGAARILLLLARYRESSGSLKLTRELAGAAAALEGIARARYGAGRGSLSDVSLARVQADSFRERAAALEGELASIRAELKYFNVVQDGASDGRDASSGDSGVARALVEPKLLSDYLRRIQSRRYEPSQIPIVASMRAMEEESLSRDTLARLNYAPDFGVFAAYGRESRELIYPVGDGRQTTYRLGFQIRVPLWSSLANHKNVEATSKEAEAANVDARDVEAASVARIKALDEQIKQARLRQGIFDQRLIPNALTARRSSVLSYQGGTVTFTDVLQAWQAYYDVNLQKLALDLQLAIWITERSELANTLFAEPFAGGEEK